MKLIKTALLLRIRKFLPEDVQLTEAVAFKAEPRFGGRTVLYCPSIVAGTSSETAVLLPDGGGDAKTILNIIHNLGRLEYGRAGARNDRADQTRTN